MNVCVWRAHACASVLTLSIISIIDTGWHFGDHGSAEQSTASSVGPLKNIFATSEGGARDGGSERERNIRARDSEK